MRANSNGRLVYPFAANYFAVETRSDQFFFEHVPGTTEEYHIYDSGGMFMGSESSGLVARTTRPAAADPEPHPRIPVLEERSCHSRSRVTRWS